MLMESAQACPVRLLRSLQQTWWEAERGQLVEQSGCTQKFRWTWNMVISNQRGSSGPPFFFGVPCGGGGGGPKTVYGGSHAIHGWLERPPSRQDSGRCLKRRHCWHVGHVDGWRTLSRFRLVQLTNSVAGVRKSLILILYLRFPWVVILSGTAFVLYHWVNDE